MNTFQLGELGEKLLFDILKEKFVDIEHTKDQYCNVDFVSKQNKLLVEVKTRSFDYKTACRFKNLFIGRSKLSGIDKLLITEYPNYNVLIFNILSDKVIGISYSWDKFESFESTNKDCLIPVDQFKIIKEFGVLTQKK